MSLPTSITITNTSVNSGSAINMNAKGINTSWASFSSVKEQPRTTVTTDYTDSLPTSRNTGIGSPTHTVIGVINLNDTHGTTYNVYTLTNGVTYPSLCKAGWTTTEDTNFTATFDGRGVASATDSVSNGSYAQFSQDVDVTNIDRLSGTYTVSSGADKDDFRVKVYVGTSLEYTSTTMNSGKFTIDVSSLSGTKAIKLRLQAISSGDVDDTTVYFNNLNSFVLESASFMDREFVTDLINYSNLTMTLKSNKFKTTTNTSGEITVRLISYNDTLNNENIVGYTMIFREVKS